MIILIWEKLLERAWNFQAARLFGNYGSMATTLTVGILAIVQRRDLMGWARKLGMSTKQRKSFQTGNIVRFLLCSLIKRTLSAMLRFKRCLKKQTEIKRTDRTLVSRVALYVNSICPLSSSLQQLLKSVTSVFILVISNQGCS